MSLVTNILVTHGILERAFEQPGLGVVAKATGRPDSPLTNIADGDAANFWGGSKFPEVDVWAGAINYMDLQATLDHLASIPWKEPENVQVFIQGQDEDRFSVYEFRDGQLTKVL